jgi:hypothetical protein
MFVLSAIAITSIMGCGPRLDVGVGASFRILKKMDSADGRWTAVLFVGGGGGTTSAATGISIWPKSETIDVSSGKGVVCSQAGVVDSVRMVWESNSQLRIVGIPDPAVGEMYLQRTRWEGIEIVYGR